MGIVLLSEHVLQRVLFVVSLTCRLWPINFPVFHDRTAVQCFLKGNCNLKVTVTCP